jgi:hypothetical protein
MFGDAMFGDACLVMQEKKALGEGRRKIPNEEEN